ncbi:unnamed protein product [Discosporangium mesarthrocarpum]
MHLETFEQDDSLKIELPIEPIDMLVATAERLKGHGNSLFNLGDEAAAAEVYHRVLKLVERPIELGAAVMVRVIAEGEDAPVKFAFGMVSDVRIADEKCCDVIYDEDHLSCDGGDEEEGVSVDRLTCLSAFPSIACATRLNLARCYAKAAQHAQVKRGYFTVFIISSFVPCRS